MPWIDEHIFVAGGDVVEAGWAEFQSQTGVSAVITVDEQTPGSFGPPLPWAVLWLAVAGEADYTLEHLRLGAQFIEVALAAGRRVLLYAPQGMHRTRPLVAAHLVWQGRSVARTLREMERKPWLPPYRGNAALLEQLRAGGGSGG